MNETLRAAVAGAANALRADGYSRAVRGGLPLGERARRYYRRRSATLTAAKTLSHATTKHTDPRTRD